MFLPERYSAFPMDGGRILRAILSARLGRVMGTRIATFVGRVIAALFIVSGIFMAEMVLGLIGLFIFMMAGKEYNQARIDAFLAKTSASEIMRTTFTRLHLSDAYSMVIEKYYREGEQNFLVFDSLGNFSGTVPELFKNNTPDKTVQQLMSSRAVLVTPGTNLKDVIELMKKEGIAIVGVGDDGHIMGILDRNGIENHIRLKSS
jgi:CBS domain-containing protein